MLNKTVKHTLMKINIFGQIKRMNNKPGDTIKPYKNFHQKEMKENLNGFKKIIRDLSFKINKRDDIMP